MATPSPPPSRRPTATPSPNRAPTPVSATRNPQTSRRQSPTARPPRRIEPDPATDVQRLRRYLVTGLVLWVPLGITIWVLTLIVGTLDQTLLLIPYRYRPETLLGFPIPGLGVVLTLVVLLVTGVLTRNLVGQQLIKGW